MSTITQVLLVVVCLRRVSCVLCLCVFVPFGLGDCVSASLCLGVSLPALQLSHESPSNEKPQNFKTTHTTTSPTQAKCQCTNPSHSNPDTPTHIHLWKPLEWLGKGKQIANTPLSHNPTTLKNWPPKRRSHAWPSRTLKNGPQNPKGIFKPIGAMATIQKYRAQP